MRIKAKQIMAWLFVLFICYVVVYSYLNPDKLVYNTAPRSILTENTDVPDVPLVKEDAPLVYYALKYDWLIFLSILIYVLADFKNSKQSFINFGQKIKRFINNKNNKYSRE